MDSNAMSFPQFPLLPMELQLKIWAFSLPAPRVVDLFAVPVSESLQPRFGLALPPPKEYATSPDPNLNPNATSPSKSDSNTNSIATEARTRPRNEGQTRPEITRWVRTYVERIYSTPQDLGCLHICPSARNLALKRCVKLNADIELKGDIRFQSLPPSPWQRSEETAFHLAFPTGHRPFALLNPSTDILFLQDPPRMRDRTGGFIISSLEILLRWLDRDVVRSLRRVAIPYYTWRKTKTAGKLGLLMEFQQLEELWVSFLGEGCLGTGRGGQGGRDGVGIAWCDVAARGGNSGEEGGLWSHVKEVEEEVRADVEGMRLWWGEWNVPRVRVVRHRGVLVEELEG